MFGGLLGTFVKAAAPSIVGRIFGGGKSKKTSNSIDYQAMVRNAEAAGINPLTALRNGGGAGHMTTHHPVMSSREFIGQAIGQGLHAAFNQPEKDQRRYELENQLMEAQIMNINQRTNYYERNGFGLNGTPTATGSDVVAPTKPVLTQSEAVNPWPSTSFFGLPTVVDGRYANAEAHEDRYGEGVGTGTGLSTLAADIWLNAKRRASVYGDIYHTLYSAAVPKHRKTKSTRKAPSFTWGETP